MGKQHGITDTAPQPVRFNSVQLDMIAHTINFLQSTGNPRDRVTYDMDKVVSDPAGWNDFVMDISSRPQFSKTRERNGWFSDFVAWNEDELENLVYDNLGLYMRYELDHDDDFNPIYDNAG